jgi:type I restriction enzyme S subunit
MREGSLFMPHDEWQPRRYADLVEVQQGFAFKSEQFSGDPASGPPLVRIRDLERQRPRAFVTGTIPSGYEVHPGDLLVGMDGDFLARRWKGPVSVLNQRVCKVRSRAPSVLYPAFLFYSLQPELDRLHRSIGQTTVKHLSARHLLGIERLLPPLPEQRRIAAILSSVEDTLEKTRAVIDQLEVVKKALLGELLTPRAGWTRAPLARVGRVVTGSTPSTREPSHWGGSIPFVTPGDLGGARVIHTTQRSVTEQGAKGGRLLPAGAVLVTCIASLGKNGIAGVPCVTNQQINALLCNAEVVPEFVYYSLAHCAERLRALAGTTSVPIVSKGRFERLELALPPRAEQVRIASALASVDDALDSNLQCLAQQAELKTGLLHALLSGRVRVSLSALEAADAPVSAASASPRPRPGGSARRPGAPRGRT